MKTATILSVLAVALLPGAAAADEKYGFDDDEFDASPPPANAWADLTDGEMVLVDEETLRATIGLGLLPEVQPGIAYGFVFGDGTHRWYAALLTTPNPWFAYGPWGEDGPLDFLDTTGSWSPGFGGSVTIDVPVSGLSDARVLIEPEAFVADIKGNLAPGGPILLLDRAIGTGRLVLVEEPADAGGTVTTASVAAEPAVEAPADDAPLPQETRAPVPLPALAAFGALALAAFRRRDA